MIRSSVKIATEVTDLLGGAMVAEMVRDMPARYCCAVCGRSDRRTSQRPATVVAAVGAAGRAFTMGFAHPNCAGSGVVDAGSLAGQGMVTGVAWLRPPETCPMPVLLISPHTRIVRTTAGGEQQDRLLAALLGQGFTLLTSPDQELPPVTGLHATVGRRRVRVANNAEVSLYSGVPGMTREWRGAARGEQHVGVVVAYGAALQDSHRALPAALARAITDGRVVGAAVPVRRGR